jgi:DNA polymerase elongation subunit (family B)
MKALSSAKAPTSGGISIMSIEIHVQCRIGKSSLNKTKEIALSPDPAQDPIFAIAYVYSLDPGNGERIQMLEHGCIFIPISKKTGAYHVPGSEKNVMIEKLAHSCKLKLEAVADERQLLHRFRSIVKIKDPDVLISWDIQCAGIGYIISRGEVLRKIDVANNQSPMDMIRLLGRTPCSRKSSEIDKDKLVDEEIENKKYAGSGLGADWDDRVGAGVLASSIVRYIPSIILKVLFMYFSHLFVEDW